MFKHTSLCIFLSIATYAPAQVTLSDVFDRPISPPPFELLSPATYEICYDLDMSPYAGGEDLLFGTRLIEKGTTYIESKTPMAYSKTMAARTWRLCELFLLYLPLNVFTSVVQHEVFGHGYRIRDINSGIVKVSGYSFSFPPPYGSGNGETSFTYNPSQIATTDLTAISMAGIEAQQILALQTKFKWLESHRIDPRQSILYLFSQYSLNLYDSGDQLDAYDISSNDLAGYVYALNLTYTRSKMTVSQLKALSWINLADPFTYYSLYAWFHYLSSGKETKIPMIPIQDYGYLFGARVGLTPFGPEFFLDNYLVKGDRPIYFYVKAGHHAGNTFLGGGCFAPRLWVHHKLSLGSRLDVWKQPQLLLYPPQQEEFPFYSYSKQNSQKYGAMATLISSYRVNAACGFQAELGYKSGGFLPGNSIYSAPIVRLSYLTHF